jgi:7,8-dihydropterin-6-yl-methyl-4-(beta-D-ribofuranosyl)aminobenzene 5'-phosphate synthase
VFGGFHLKSAGEQTIRTIEYLEKNSISKVFPSHCTSLPALVEFYKTFRIIQVLSGNYYNFN